MKKMIVALAACAMTLPAMVSADALSDARAASICDVTRAEYLEDGKLKVWCVPGTVNPAYAGAVQGGAAGGLTGGTLSPTAAAGIAAGVLIIALAASDDDTTTTTTTTSGS